MRFFGKLVYAMIISLCITTAAFSAEKAIFATFPIPLMVVDENNGIFIELTKSISSRANLDIEITIAPPKRTIFNFNKKKVDVMFPSVDMFFQLNETYVKSTEIIYIKTDYIFNRKNSPLLTTIKSLEGKRVGLTRGYPYARKLTTHKEIQIQFANSDNINVRKLLAKRIDAFVVEEKSGLKAFENLGNLNQMQYDPAFPIFKQDVFYAFQDSVKGKRLNQLISKALSAMKKDGTFSEIMAKAQ